MYSQWILNSRRYGICNDHHHQCVFVKLCYMLFYIVYIDVVSNTLLYIYLHWLCVSISYDNDERNYAKRYERMLWKLETWIQINHAVCFVTDLCQVEIVVNRCYLSHNSRSLPHTSIERDTLLMGNYASVIVSGKTVLKLNRRNLKRQLRPFL